MLDTNTRKSPQNRPDSSLSPTSTRGLTMLRSIQVKPASLDSQQIMMRLLMISIQLDRKDYIIRELLTAASNHEQHDIINQLSTRCQRYEIQIKTLTQTIVMLKDNISNFETFKSKEMLSSASLFNEQLQNKIMNLENKLRKTQEDKIELEEELKKNKMNQSMAEYQLIKNQQGEKSRARELESLLMTERNKLENQRKISIEKNIVIEDLKNRVMEVQNRQRYIVQQYEDRIKLIQHQITFQQTMKKSQIVSTEQKINASVQQINKLVEENRYLKQNIQQLRQNIQTKERDLASQVAEHRALQNQFHRQQNELKECNIKLQGRIHQFRIKDRQILEKENIVKKLHTETEQLKFHLSTRTQQIDVYSEQINRLKSQLSDLYNQIDSQKIQIRKLKRKPNTQSVMCQSCRVRETTVINNQKKIKILDISEILEQAEGVLRSNRKIQSLISLQEERGIDSQFKAYRDQAYNA